MGYREIKQELRNHQKSYKSIQMDSKKIQAEILDYENSRFSLKEKYEHELRTKRNQEIVELKRKYTEPFEKKINKLTETKGKVLKDQEEELSLITKENYLKEYAEDFDMNNKIKEMAEELKDTITDALGDRFSNVVYSIVDTNTFSLEFDSIEEVEYRVQSLMKKVKRISLSKSFNFHKVINNIWGKWDVSKIEGNQMNLIIYIILALILSLMVYKYLFPFLIFAYMIMVILNIWSSNTIYDCILETKILLDNIETINEGIEKIVEQQLQDDYREVSTKYRDFLDDINFRIEKEEEKMAESIELAEKNFVFDGSLTEKSWKTEESSLDDKISLARAKLKEKTDLANQELDAINKLSKELESAVQDIKQEYLPADVDNDKLQFLFQSEFLYDIDGNEPIFFEHPEKSCLFLYKAEHIEDIKQFIRLMCLQTMARMKVTAYKNYIIDLTYGCTDFKLLGVNENLVEFGQDDKELTDILNSLIDILREKSTTISAYNDIKQYNKELLAMGSLSERYTPVYYLNPELSKLLEHTSNQLIRKGAMVGVYMNLFVDCQKFFEDRTNGEELLDSVDTVYIYDGSRFMSRAKEFIKDNLPKK